MMNSDNAPEQLRLGTRLKKLKCATEVRKKAESSNKYVRLVQLHNLS